MQNGPFQGVESIALGVNKSQSDFLSRVIGLHPGLNFS